MRRPRFRLFRIIEVTVLLLLCGALSRVSYTALRAADAEKVIIQQLAALEEEVISTPLPAYGLHVVFQRANQQRGFVAPYSHLQLEEKVELYLFRRRLAYEGYSFDLLLYGGWHFDSPYQHIRYSFSVNGSEYRYAKREVRTDHGQ